MYSHNESFPPALFDRLAASPAIRHDGRWWLTGNSGSVLVTDPAFTGVLDGFATTVAAADQAVAALRARRATPPTTGPGGQR